MDVEIRLFGPLEIVTPTGRLRSTDFPTRKSKQVLQVLALAEGRAVSKDRLVDILWRRRMPRRPAATVELAVSLLRSTLVTVTDRRVIVTEPGGYRVDLEVADIDTLRFERVLDQSAEHPRSERLALLLEAVRVAERPLFEDELLAEWVVADRDRFRRKVEAALLDAGRLALADNEVALAHQLAERAWRDSDVVLEEAYALGVAALAQSGRRHEARVLLEELELRLIHEEARALAPESAALRALLVAPSRTIAAGVEVAPAFLTAPATPPLLGRDAVLAKLLDAIGVVLRPTHVGGRLVLLEGSVGAGATRILQEVRQQLEADGGMHVFTMRGTADDRSHPMLAVGHLLRAVARATKQRKSVTIDEAVAPMFGRLADLLDGLGPTVVLVDGLHHLDDASMAVVRALLEPDAVPQLCIVAAQWPASDEVLPRAAAHATVELPLLRPVDLTPLGVDGAWQETGGHPATVAVCCAAAQRDLLLSLDEIEVVLSRLDQLGDLGRPAMRAASVLPMPFKGVDLAHELRLGQALVSDLLRRAVACGVLVGDARHGYSFSSDLMWRILRAGRQASEPVAI